MRQLRRIDIERGPETYKEIERRLEELAKILRDRYKASKILVFGSYVSAGLNEGSDIDLVVVGDFKERFHKRAVGVIGLTDLPIEPLCYTEEEFRAMNLKWPDARQF